MVVTGFPGLGLLRSRSWRRKWGRGGEDQGLCLGRQASYSFFPQGHLQAKVKE